MQNNSYRDLIVQMGGTREIAFVETDATYTIHYYCSAKNPNKKLTDEARRVARVREVTATGEFFDKTFPLKGGESTSDFVFAPVDLATVSALTYKVD